MPCPPLFKLSGRPVKEEIKEEELAKATTHVDVVGDFESIADEAHLGRETTADSGLVIHPVIQKRSRLSPVTLKL